MEKWKKSTMIWLLWSSEKDSATIMASLVVATRKGVAREVLCGMLRVFLQRDVSSENSLMYIDNILRAYFEILKIGSENSGGIPRAYFQI